MGKQSTHIAKKEWMGKNENPYLLRDFEYSE